jgi:hypothetical protein
VNFPAFCENRFVDNDVAQFQLSVMTQIETPKNTFSVILFFKIASQLFLPMIKGLRELLS